MSEMDFSNGIKVCIGNKGYYAEGELRDTWITLPKSDKEIEQFLTRNGLKDSMHEEIYISDYYGGVPFGCTEAFNEHTSLSDLNLFAKQVMCASAAELEAVQACFDVGCGPLESVVEVMNLVEQAEKIPYTQYNFSGIDEVNAWGQTGRERYSKNGLLGYTLLENDPKTKQALDNNPALEFACNIERYGQFYAERNHLAVCDNGYVKLTDNFPYVHLLSREKLKERIEERFDDNRGGSASESHGKRIADKQAVFDQMKDFVNEGHEVVGNDKVH